MHRFKIDEMLGFVITTHASGGLLVSSLDTGEVLFSLATVSSRDILSSYTIIMATNLSLIYYTTDIRPPVRTRRVFPWVYNLRQIRAPRARSMAS